MKRPAGISAETPVEAFERFIELVRKTPVTKLHLIQNDLFELLRPFLINPQRYEAQVRQIVLMIGRAYFSEAIRPSRFNGIFMDTRPLSQRDHGRTCTLAYHAKKNG